MSGPDVVMFQMATWPFALPPHVERVNGDEVVVYAGTTAAKVEVALHFAAWDDLVGWIANVVDQAAQVALARAGISAMDPDTFDKAFDAAMARVRSRTVGGEA